MGLEKTLFYDRSKRIEVASGNHVEKRRGEECAESAFGVKNETV